MSPSKKVMLILPGVAFLLSAFAAAAQQPTHIDPGSGDPSVYITDNPGYILLIVALVVIMVIWFVLLRRSRKSKRGESGSSQRS